MNATTNNSSSRLEKTAARPASKSPSNPATLEKLILLRASLTWSVTHPEGAQPGSQIVGQLVNWAW